MGRGAWVVVAACVGAWACGSTEDGGTGPQGGPAPVEDGPGQVVPPPPACIPTSCAALGFTCGDAPDGCGGVQRCGTCAAGETCGGGGAPNVCGRAACEPRTCAQAGAVCGALSDGCGGLLECGTCAAGEVCRAGRCDVQVPECQPLTCAEAGAVCGALPDGCGGTLACGTCAAGQLCGVFGAPNTCAAPPRINCADEDLGARLPVSVRGVIPWSSSRFFARTCGDNPMGADSPERTFAWHAPADGTYVIDSAGSAFNTLVYVRRGGCTGEELACNDNGVSHGGASQVVVTLAAGEGVVIVLDAAQPAWQSVGYQLHISARASTEGRCSDGADDDGDGQVDCRDSDCQGQAACAGEACADERITQVPAAGAALEVRGETGMGSDDFTSACAWAGQHGSDRAFLFTAPRDGTFTFSIHARQFPPALSLVSGCGGGELMCTTTHGDFGFAAHAGLTLARGSSVLVVVDQLFNTSASQAFELYVNEWVPSEHGLLCTDRADNDGDGVADDYDPDCAPAAP